tara:strand:- start:27457 stop:27702 length:246 start_codon:yes stop_codon:yes gene_type:complete
MFDLILTKNNVMQKILSIESFQSFRVSKEKMKRISGARSKSFQFEGGACAKSTDSNDGSNKVTKIKPRYVGKCGLDPDFRF